MVAVDQCVHPPHATGAYLKRFNQPSNQPDLRILKLIQTVQTVCLIGVGLIAAGIVCGWVVRNHSR